MIGGEVERILIFILSLLARFCRKVLRKCSCAFPWLFPSPRVAPARRSGSPWRLRDFRNKLLTRIAGSLGFPEQPGARKRQVALDGADGNAHFFGGLFLGEPYEVADLYEFSRSWVELR